MSHWRPDEALGLIASKQTNQIKTNNEKYHLYALSLGQNSPLNYRCPHSNSYPASLLRSFMHISSLFKMEFLIFFPFSIFTLPTVLSSLPSYFNSIKICPVNPGQNQGSNIISFSLSP
jgi:hypothetical protein